MMNNPPKDIAEAVAFIAKWTEQYHRLKDELEKADKVISVMLHGYLVPHLSGTVLQQMHDDLRMRGLSGHEQTRAEILQEVLYG